MSNYHSIFSKTDEIIDRLELLDILCQEQYVQAELVILGASGILLCMELNKRTFRPTKDIDINLLSTSDFKKIQELLRKVEIDTVGGVMELPPMVDDYKPYMLNPNNLDINVYELENILKEKGI